MGASTGGSGPGRARTSSDAAAAAPAAVTAETGGREAVRSHCRLGSLQWFLQCHIKARKTPKQCKSIMNGFLIYIRTAGPKLMAGKLCKIST